MKSFNLIIICIVIVITIVIGIYLYKNNIAKPIDSNKKVITESFQIVGTPIKIADMATTIMGDTKDNAYEYAVIKMAARLKSITNTERPELQLFNNASYVSPTYPSVSKSANSSISVDNATGVITLNQNKRYKVFISVNKAQLAGINLATLLDVFLYAYNSANNVISDQIYMNSALIPSTLSGLSATVDVCGIVSGAVYIVPFLQYRDKINLSTNNQGSLDTFSYLFIETI